MRSALAAAIVAFCALPAAAQAPFTCSWTDHPVTPGMELKAQHVNEIRNCLDGIIANWPGTQTDPPDTRWRGIRVEPEAGRDGYSRPSWNVPDTEIYARDGSPACTPYTRTPITTVGVGDGLDREHVVALAEAWDSRPDGFAPATLRRIAEDHDNLTLAVASANRSKGLPRRRRVAAGTQRRLDGPPHRGDQAPVRSERQPV